MSKITPPSGFRVPGAVWAVVIIVGMAVAHRYLDDPFIIELLFVAGGLLMPLVVDNDAQLKKALAAIELLTNRPVTTLDRPDSVPESHEPGMRSARSVVTPAGEPLVVEVPDPPNRMVTYLFG